MSNIPNPTPEPSLSKLFQAELQRRKGQHKQYLGPPSLNYQEREIRWKCIQLMGDEKKVDALYWKLKALYPGLSTFALYQKILNDDRYLRGDRLG